LNGLNHVTIDEYVAGPIGPTLVAIAAAEPRFLCCIDGAELPRPRVAAFAIARAQRTGLITTPAAAALLLLGAFLSFSDYNRD
jgi:hypothetical protein